LIVKGSEVCLDKKYFGGGTVTGAIASERYARFRNEIHAKFEDGTVPFAAIASLQFGFKILDSLQIDKITL
jgi:molybdenum cofactor sulfurtransferase